MTRRIAHTATPAGEYMRALSVALHAGTHLLSVPALNQLWAAYDNLDHATPHTYGAALSEFVHAFAGFLDMTSALRDHAEGMDLADLYAAVHHHEHEVAA